MRWSGRCGVRFPHPSVMTLVTTPPGAPGGGPKTLIPEAARRLNTYSVPHGATHDQGLAQGVVLSVTSDTEPTIPNRAQQKPRAILGPQACPLPLFDMEQREQRMGKQDQKKWNLSYNIMEGWNVERPRWEGVASRRGNGLRSGKEAARCRSHRAPRGARGTERAGAQMGHMLLLWPQPLAPRPQKQT